ncbi:Dihydroneopterin aldolase/epimerase domain containing protein [Trema orientale]|uniref:dihydroneopterin aldolase n=1 Tax=Trema orientale TaxID=63057 RepID=A0A2P5D689_TREOI|nr:Dihydroneopterin aldolase/epimerase domain containing protein [Trema orientale]
MATPSSGLLFHGFHGVNPETRKLGQKFLVDVCARLDLGSAGVSDRLSDTISYANIYRVAKEVVEGQPHNLPESVAQLIASTTLITETSPDFYRSCETWEASRCCCSGSC